MTRPADSPVSVLLIEDEPVARMLAEEGLLAAGGFRVACAGSLQEGLDRLSRDSYQLILLDLTLPDSDGLDTFLRVQARVPEIPIVILTARSDDGMGLTAVWHGAQEFLTKSPETAANLPRTLRRSLLRHDRLNRTCENRFRTLLNRQADGVVVTSPDGVVVYANPAAEELLGKPVRALVGTVLPFLLNPAPVFEQDMAGGVAEVRVADFDWEGGPALLASLRDITERKAAERALQEARRSLEIRNAELERRHAELAEERARAQKAHQTKNQFLACVSHEVRTPIIGVLGMVDLLRESNLSPEQRDYADVIGRSVEDLLTILNDLLDLSRIEAGRLDFESIEFGLRDCLGLAGRLLAAEANRRGCAFSLVVEPDVPDSLVGDPLRLRQVVLNLAFNAIKFTGPGSVQVRARRDWLAKDEMGLEVSVEDTGPGIPEERQKAIFEAFSQADGTVYRRFGGTGLGLTISAELVRRMGGRIWLESRPGEGATFHFTARFGLRREVEDPQPVDLERVVDVRALVLIGREASRRRLVETLAGWGMDPIPAETVERALELLEQGLDRKRPFEIALLDRNLPDGDGFEAAAAIRQRPYLDPMRLVMLADAGFRGDAARCRAMGIQAYLAKPVQEAALMEAVCTALAAPATALVTRHSLREARSRLRVLIVEDDAPSRTAAVRLLEGRGFRVTAVADGAGALEALDSAPFDAIMVDLGLPDLPGPDLVARIREREAAGDGGRMAILAVTAHGTDETRRRCEGLDVDGYMPKPYRVPLLYAVLESLCGVVPGPGDVEDARRSGQVSELLDRFGGSAHVLKETAGSFLEGAGELVALLREALEQDDALAVEHMAHRIKGSAGLFDGGEVVALAAEMEDLAAGGDLAGARLLADRLEGELGLFRESLEATVSSLSDETAGATS